MDKTTLNAHLSNNCNMFFITSNVLTSEDQICGKVLVWLS